MKKSKVYKVTTQKMITNFPVSAIVVSLCYIGLLIYSISHTKTSSDLLILVLVISFMVIFFGIYPIYLYWCYFQKDKNVTIFVDYDNLEFQYAEKGKEIRYIKFDDIDIVEHHCVQYIGPNYYKIILKNNEFVIITSLLINGIVGLIPKISSKIESSNKLLLPSSSDKM